jgi:hypothetical protein
LPHFSSLGRSYEMAPREMESTLNAMPARPVCATNASVAWPAPRRQRRVCARERRCTNRRRPRAAAKQQQQRPPRLVRAITDARVVGQLGARAAAGVRLRAAASASAAAPAGPARRTLPQRAGSAALLAIGRASVRRYHALMACATVFCGSTLMTKCTVAALMKTRMAAGRLRRAAVCPAPRLPPPVRPFRKSTGNGAPREGHKATRNS